MGTDVGLDKFGNGVGRYVTWGYLPHEYKYQKPTIENRNASMWMPSGTYNAQKDIHTLMEHGFCREDMEHAWYEETGSTHPFERVTKPIAKNDPDFNGKCSWATSVSHADFGRLEAGPFAREMVYGGKHGESWQHHDPLVLDMYKKMGGASVLLRHFARMHEVKAIYRNIGYIVRNLASSFPASVLQSLSALLIPHDEV